MPLRPATGLPVVHEPTFCLRFGAGRRGSRGTRSRVEGRGSASSRGPLRYWSWGVKHRAREMSFPRGPRMPAGSMERTTCILHRTPPSLRPIARMPTRFPRPNPFPENFPRRPHGFPSLGLPLRQTAPPLPDRSSQTASAPHTEDPRAPRTPRRRQASKEPVAK